MPWAFIFLLFLYGDGLDFYLHILIGCTVLGKPLLEILVLQLSRQTGYGIIYRLDEWVRRTDYIDIIRFCRLFAGHVIFIYICRLKERCSRLGIENTYLVLASTLTLPSCDD